MRKIRRRPLKSWLIESTFWRSEAPQSELSNNCMRSECLQGTLDLMVLKTLETMGPLHGYGIARRIELVSRDLLQMNQGTLYPALVRLEQKRYITSKWGLSENNRRANYYSISKAGRKQLAVEQEHWDRISTVMATFIRGFKEA